LDWTHARACTASLYRALSLRCVRACLSASLSQISLSCPPPHPPALSPCHLPCCFPASLPRAPSPPRSFPPSLPPCPASPILLRLSTSVAALPVPPCSTPTLSGCTPSSAPSAAERAGVLALPPADPVPHPFATPEGSIVSSVVIRPAPSESCHPTSQILCRQDGIVLLEIRNAPKSARKQRAHATNAHTQECIRACVCQYTAWMYTQPLSTSRATAPQSHALHKQAHAVLNTCHAVADSIGRPLPGIRHAPPRGGARR